MSQAWLQVIGLIVEFVGVLLLAWEWFAAQRQEAAERAIESAHARQEESMARLQQVGTPNPSMQRHFEMSRDLQRRMTESRVSETRRSYTGMRGRAVAFALVFIVAGFVVQLMGAWPGCCRVIGIVPGG
ncbi:MAG: hypothetical protein ACKVP7_27920 [Hyphomicrobiaceae bacterium]